MADTLLEMDPPKLPVWSTVIASYRLTFANLAWFFSMAWLWLSLLAVAVGAYSWLVWPYTHADELADKPNFLQFGTFPISTLVASALAVAWHRWLLLGDAGQRPTFHIDRPVVKYFAWTMLMILALVPPLLPLMIEEDWLTQTEIAKTDSEDAADQAALATPSGQAPIAENQANRPEWSKARSVFVLIAGGAGGLGIFITAYVFTRIGLIFPAVAVGRSNFRVRESWRLTKGNFWRLFMGTVLTSVLPATVLALPELVWDNQDASHFAFMIQQLISECGTIIVGMIGVTFLTLSYRHFVLTSASPAA